LHPFVSRTSWAYQQFDDDVDTYFATTIIVPDDLDTSCPLKFTWEFIVKDTTALGDILWEFEYQYIKPGDVVSETTDNWLTSDTVSQTSIPVSMTSDSINKLQSVFHFFDLLKSMPGTDTLAIKLTRKGTATEDTYDGAALLINCYMQYTSFVDGRNITQLYESGH
jgi:hypothetical protein